MDSLLDTLGLHSPALFALSVLVLNATPGVDVLCITSSTLKGGARAGVAAAVGISLGCVVHALLAAFGLAALLAVSAWAFGALKLAGAAYLAWLAWGMLRAAWRPAVADASGASAPASTAAASPTAPSVSPAQAHTARSPERLALRQGLLTNVLNPKVALFYLAFLPQFIQPGTAHKTLAFLVLGAWFVLQSLAFLLVLVAVLLRLRGLGQRAWVRRSVQGLGGVLFLALAGRLLSARNA